MSDDVTALIRRIDAAVYGTKVRRAEVGLEWPECHRKNCQGHHGEPESALALMMSAIGQSVRAELGYRSVTRPDVAEPGDTQENVATYTLATLLGRYTSGSTGGAGTFVRAAELMIEAYPGLVSALTPAFEPGR